MTVAQLSGVAVDGSAVWRVVWPRGGGYLHVVVVVVGPSQIGQPEHTDRYGRAMVPPTQQSVVDA